MSRWWDDGFFVKFWRRICGENCCGLPKKHPFPRVSTGRHLHRCPRFEKRRKQWGHLWSLQQIPQNVDAFAMKGTCRVVAFCYFCWLSSSKFRVRGNDQGMKTKHFGKGYVMILMNECCLFFDWSKKMLGIHYFLESEKRWKEMGVSKYRYTTPKWMGYNGKPYQNGWFGGKTHFFRFNIQMIPLLEGLALPPRYLPMEPFKDVQTPRAAKLHLGFWQLLRLEAFTADPKITPKKIVPPWI